MPILLQVGIGIGVLLVILLLRTLRNLIHTSRALRHEMEGMILDVLKFYGGFAPTKYSPGPRFISADDLARLATVSADSPMFQHCLVRLAAAKLIEAKWGCARHAGWWYRLPSGGDQ